MDMGQRFARALADEIVSRKTAKTSETWQEFLDFILKDLKSMEYHPGYLPGPYWIPSHLENALDGTDLNAIAAWSKLTTQLQSEQLVLRKDNLLYLHASTNQTRPAYVVLYVGNDMPKHIKEMEEYRTNIGKIARRMGR